MMQKFFKQENDVLDYTVDLAKWIVAGDTVTSSTASVSPSDLTISVTNSATSSPKVWVSGGTNGSSYQITLTVDTNVGRTKEFEFIIVVAEL